MVVFMNDPPLAEREVDFAVLWQENSFIVLWQENMPLIICAIAHIFSGFALFTGLM